MVRLPRMILATCLGVAISASSLVSVVEAAPTASTLTSNYTVRAGDYLSGIAFKLNVNLRDLLAANKMTVTSLIVPGQVLTVPVALGTANPAPESASTVTTASATATSTKGGLTYTVVSGDYLTGIAQKLSVSTRSLLEANGLQINSLIYPGMTLKVPKGGTLPASPTTTTAPVSTSTTPAKAAATKYTVVSGDYLAGIAVKLGVSLTSLLATNQMTVTSVIHPGMRLTVPKGGKLPDERSTSTTAPSTTVPSTSTTTPASAAGGTKVPASIATVLAFARAQLGKPYKRFATGPDSYDCSGLTMAAYATIGIQLPHYSGAQISFGTVVDWTTEPIKAGDLIFLETAPGSGVIGHVGMATSATTWIQAPRTGDVVREGAFNPTRIVGVRRLVNG